MLARFIDPISFSSASLRAPRGRISISMTTRKRTPTRFCSTFENAELRRLAAGYATSCMDGAVNAAA
jgi:hypothetical protein